MIIDAHTHVGSMDRTTYPLVSNERHQGSIWYLDHGVTTERLLELMDEACVASAVLVQAFGSHGTDNRYAIDSARTYSNRTVGVGAIDVREEPDPRERVRIMIEQEGLNGIRLADSGTGTIGDPGTVEIAREVATLGVPLLIVTIATQVPLVRALLEKVPRARVVLDHCASPDLTGGPPWREAESVLALAEFPNVYLKVSSMTIDQVQPSEAPALLEVLASRFGADRLLWGSDFSHTHDRPYASLVAAGRKAAESLIERDRDSFLGGTASRLWPTLSPSPRPEMGEAGSLRGAGE